MLHDECQLVENINEMLKVGVGLKRQNTWHRLLSPQDTLDLKKQDTFDLNKNKDVIDQITSTVWWIKLLYNYVDLGLVSLSIKILCTLVVYILQMILKVPYEYSLLWFICPDLSPKILAVMF